MKKGIDGYFTVEAALLMPFVLGVTVLVVYMWFFQYDRVFLDLDAGAIALRAAEVSGQKAQERADYALSEAQGIYFEKYIAWEKGGLSAEMDHGKVIISLNGGVRFPFAGLSFWNPDTVWETGTQRTGTVLRPALLIRTYRKIRGAASAVSERAGGSGG